MHFHAWLERTRVVHSRHEAMVMEMLRVRCRRMLNLWQRLARTRRMARARGAQCAAKLRRRRLQFGIAGWLQASEILRTRMALDLGTMERVLHAWWAWTRCATVRRHVDKSWRCRRLSCGLRSWAWIAGRRSWCRRVTHASDRLRGHQVLLRAMVEWRSASVRARHLHHWWFRLQRRQQR